MSEKIEEINEIFRIHEETAAINSSEVSNEVPEDNKINPKKNSSKKSSRVVRNILLDEENDESHNYTGDSISERDYRPVRQSHEYKSGILGSMMYLTFIICVSIVLAVFAWMAVSDVLALNKDNFSSNVTLPSSAFSTITVDDIDDDGNKTGEKKVSSADIEYVSSALKEAGLIEYRWLFEFFCKISNADLKLDPGTYTLKSSYDYRALVQHMQVSTGNALTVTVTIPEAFTMQEIFLRLEENGVASYDDLMEAAANYNYKYSFLNGSATGDAARLEGFLFPDTYEFYVGMQASSAINKFLDNFNSKFTTDLQKQAEYAGYSIKDILTIASLIEKEAAVDTETGTDERKIVASVIYNRLKSSMPLGLESSILYIYPDYSGAPTAEMLETDSPYNVNINKGLPPTPICNPGMASIAAALNPDSTGYYYFTLDTATGAHKFFTNYNEFLNFVATQNYD